MINLAPARLPALILALLWASGVRAEPFPSIGTFAVTYTFTTSTPATPTDIGSGRDLTVNNYLATTINDAGRGLMHNMAGHCTNIRFTNRDEQTIDSKGYCNFRDADGDVLFAEYVTGVVPSKAITFTMTFVSGNGKYDGITGRAQATNTNNLDDQGAYQAAGRMTGSYKILRSSLASENGTHD